MRAARPNATAGAMSVKKNHCSKPRARRHPVRGGARRRRPRAAAGPGRAGAPVRSRPAQARRPPRRTRRAARPAGHPPAAGVLDRPARLRPRPAHRRARRQPARPRPAHRLLRDVRPRAQHHPLDRPRAGRPAALRGLGTDRRRDGRQAPPRRRPLARRPAHHRPGRRAGDEERAVPHLVGRPPRDGARPRHEAVPPLHRGDLEIAYEALEITGETDQTVFVYTTEPGSASEQAIRLLASWTAPGTTDGTTDRADSGGAEDAWNRRLGWPGRSSWARPLPECAGRPAQRDSPRGAPGWWYRGWQRAR